MKNFTKLDTQKIESSDQRQKMVLAFLVTMFFPLVLSGKENSWFQFGGPKSDFSVAGSRLEVENLSFDSSWSIELGFGKSGVVANGDNAFVSYRKPVEGAENNSNYLECISSIELSTGKVNWTYKENCIDLKKQESFSGDPRSPQATPLVHDEYVIALGFTAV